LRRGPARKKIKAGQDNYERTTRTGHNYKKPGQESQERTARKGSPRKDRQERTARKSHPGKESQDKTARIRLVGKDFQDRTVRSFATFSYIPLEGFYREPIFSVDLFKYTAETFFF
jgi:hypothetical protein